LPDSPFYLTLFTQESGRLRRVNAAKFAEDGDAHRLETRWLHPREKQGPVIMLRFGVGDEGEWVLVTYPDGIAGRAFVQKIGFGGDQSYSSFWRFDLIDKRGVMILRNEYEEGEKHEVTFLKWNGRKFN